MPAGNGILSGRWTKILSFLGELTATQAGQLGLWATRLLGPTAIVAGAIEVFRTILVPSANRIRIEGDIKGLPGGHYSWNRDESELHITYQDADGEERTFTARRKAQEFLDGVDASSATSFLAIRLQSTATLSPEGPQNNEPKLCPLPKPDRRTNDKGLAYEAFMRPLVNPGMPTPLGFGLLPAEPVHRQGSRVRRLSADDRQHD